MLQIQSLRTQIDELKTKLEELTENHKLEIGLLKQQKLKLNSRIQSLTDEIAGCEEKLKEVIVESDAKVSGSHVRKTPNITDCAFYQQFSK